MESNLRSGQISRDIAFLAEVLEQNENEHKCVIRWFYKILIRLCKVNKTEICVDILEQIREVTILAAKARINKKGKIKESIKLFLDNCQYLV